MYRYDDFTRLANISLKKAFDIAGDFGHTYIGSEHILLGISSEGTAKVILRSAGLTEEKIKDKIEELVGRGLKTKLSPDCLTPTSGRILDEAVNIAEETGARLAGTEHILMAILKEKGSSAYGIIKDLGGGIPKMYSDCADAFAADDSSSRTAIKLPNLCKFGKDMNVLAAKNRCDPVFARDKEIERVMQILSRRTKNNPCLVGEAGVGKTAIAEGIARLLARNNVPDILKGKHLFSLDIPSMVAGAKYRGDFEERIKSCIEEVASSENVILFIDEIHTIVGAGAAEGAIDAANILKPRLARGDIQIIGATTAEEYRRYIEKDAALERRFQPVEIEEPSEENAVRILKGVRECYEKHHKVNISDEAVTAAVSLSKRYINDRFLPDKAIDLIDEACSRKKLKSGSGFFVKAADEFDILKEAAERNRNCTKSDETVGEDDIAEIVAMKTGIPVSRLTEGETKRLFSLEENIRKRIIGQNNAVTAVCNAIRRSRTGLKDEKKPIGTFLFCGPTGVGKTELCKALAEALFNDENNVIHIDMTEFSESFSSSRLIGSPPGYVGFENGGQLTEKVRRKPYSVVLFDEIEKAHPDIFNLMLRILDEGVIEDSHGRKADFKNCVIIMTSNIGGDIVTGNKKIGFENYDNEREKAVLCEVRKRFSPEFVNRIDKIVVFDSLSEIELKKIASKLLGELSERAHKIGISLLFDDLAVSALCSSDETKKYGARALKREVAEKAENLISEKLINGEIKSGDEILLTFRESRFEIAVTSAQV
ncbi:MAG: ATP-dependent Clp protease ATP-binding subunit [Oscillospiraceae bacterium]